MNYRKKLIEVDLPLDDINREASREKTGTRVGHSEYATYVVGTEAIGSLPLCHICQFGRTIPLRARRNFLPNQNRQGA